MKPIRDEIARLLEQVAASSCAHTQGKEKAILQNRDALWTFGDDPAIEPTHYAAERAIRHAVILRKLTFGTQSARGSRFIECMLSAVNTLINQDRDVLPFPHLTPFKPRPPTSRRPRSCPAWGEGVNAYDVYTLSNRVRVPFHLLGCNSLVGVRFRTMTIAWRVSEDARSIYLHGRVELAVLVMDASLVDIALPNAREQATFWTQRNWTCDLRGRQAHFAFDIAVRGVAGPTEEHALRVLGRDPLDYSRGTPSPSSVARVRRAAEALSPARRRAVNLILAGAFNWPPSEARRRGLLPQSRLMSRRVVLWTSGDVRADGTTVDDLVEYGRSVRVLRRPWIGGSQLQALANYVLHVSRRQEEGPRSDLLATTLGDASDHLVVAYEGRQQRY